MTTEQLMELRLTIEIHEELQRHAQKLADFKIRANSPHLDVLLANAIDHTDDAIEEL